ncbi:MAG: Bax inhibitor-1/YccA family protein [Zoogloeaceae bacterium]|jgi:modulator of FtsH protease|nr:Bax inhibitor-1/YccA family protein [Zoogloeaceae bacterium]
MSLNVRPYSSNTVPASAGAGIQGSVEAHRVLRNTYLLLAMTLAFSGAVAGVSAALNLPYLGPVITLIGYFGLLFAVTKFRDSGIGVVLVFALTGFMGYTLGPLIHAYLGLANGATIVTMAMGGTAAIFFAMSAIALTTKRDLGFLGNFLAVGLLVAFLAGLAALFFNVPMLALAVSAAFLLLSSGVILWQTNSIIRGGETNYVMATVTLYISIYNLFVSLLHLLGALSGDD